VNSSDFLIVGGGIAGLSAAARLARHGRVTVLEAEEALGYHSSGRSVSFSHYGIGNAVVRGLTAYSRHFFERQPEDFCPSPLSRRTPSLWFATEAMLPALEALEADMAKFTDAIGLVGAAEMAALCPVLRTGAGAAVRGLLDPTGLKLDTDALLQAFTRAIRAEGSEVWTDARIASIEPGGDGWSVWTETGHQYSAPVLINAAGAWADRIAALAGVRPLGLEPKRRTIIVVDPPAGADPRAWPFVHSAASDFYMLPEAGQLLASPVDELEDDPCDAQPDEYDVALAAHRLQQYTTISVTRIAHRWAGLRSFVADRVPTAGFAPDAPGFFWLAGQGGYGFQTAPAMAEIVEALILGEAWPSGLTALGVTPGRIRPERLLAAPPNPDFNRSDLDYRDSMRIDQPQDWQDLPPASDGRREDGERKPPERPTRRWRWRHIIFGMLALFLLLLGWLAVTAPLSKSLQPIAAPSLTLLSAEGDPIARRGADIRAPVRIADLPKHVPAAFVAIEDRRFRDHLGISVRGIARAAWRNAGAGGVREGGSTITQQLAKISFLTSERTAARKAQEVLIAFWLEAWLTKDEILERYLSNVYLGDNVYGLRAASHHYFSREPEELTVAEAAMLAGMVKAPSRLAPTRSLKAARARARVVIAQMVREGSLSRAEANKLKPARLRLERVQDVPTGTYFADWVLPVARAQSEAGYGEQRVLTTLETRLQTLALRTVRRARLGKAQVALVAMRPDGRVVAMVGGKDYAKSPFNRATQARRQPGSTFKLFVYLAALRAGLSPDDAIEDRPLRIGAWQPKNYGDRYRGTLTLRDAFALSSNVAAVRLSERVGRANVIRAARDLGVTSPLGDHPSLALGTSGVTLLEMTSAYAAVAAGAYPVRPRGLEEADKPWYQRLWASTVGTSGDSSFDELRELLSAVVTGGTGRSAALRVPTFGKTGTSQDNRDAIFIGFTEDLVVGVWVGNDDNTPLGQVGGGGLPARIWRDFTALATGSGPARAAPPPSVRLPVDAEGLNGAITIPLEGTGYQIGVDVGENGATISAQPNPDDRDRPPPDDAPTITLPPIAPPPKEEPAEGPGG
jgi:penicillin-binding protein 1A